MVATTMTSHYLTVSGELVRKGYESAALSILIAVATLGAAMGAACCTQKEEVDLDAGVPPEQLTHKYVMKAPSASTDDELYARLQRGMCKAIADCAENGKLEWKLQGQCKPPFECKGVPDLIPLYQDVTP